MSQRHSGRDPIEGDRFITPHWPISALCSVELFPQPIWEPACGNGDMADSIWNCAPMDAPREVVQSDISQGEDFFDYSEMLLDSKSIITNPPYSNGLAEKFIRHALKLTKPVSGKVAMLLPINHDAAQTRRYLYAENAAFVAKHILTKRIRWTNLEQISSPSMNHAWFIFDWSQAYGTPPALGYLP